MAVIISNNMVLASKGIGGNAPVLAYKNILNVNNVTASSALPSNPITDVANPATAYTWKSAVADYAGAVSYPNVTNLMPSPFDPSGWPVDSDGTITNVTMENPSGEPVAGLAEQTGAGYFLLNRKYSVSVSMGENLYVYLIVKKVGGIDFEIALSINDSVGSRDTRFSSASGFGITANANDDTSILDLGDGYYLLGAKSASRATTASASSEIILMGTNGVTAPIGSQLYVQAAFFGKSPLEYPYAQYNEFESASEAGEWSPANVNIVVNNGVLEYTSTQNDPQIVRSVTPFSGAKFTHFVTRWKRNQGSVSNQFFWRNDNNYTGANSLTFHETTTDSRVTVLGPDQDGFYTSIIDLSTTDSWTGSEGDIKGLRLDYGFDGVSDFDIDYIKVYSPYLLDAYENYWPALVDESGIKINVNTAGQTVDYIGIARHNLNQIGLTVTVRYNGITIVNAVPVSDVQALLFLQNRATPDNVEIIIKGATIPPQIGVIYMGEALRLERNIYVGHTPITYGRNRTTINGVSENGQYLGEITVRQNNVSSVNLQNLTASWYRTMLDPFFALTPRPPFFWAWRPETYPDEVGYAWLEGEPSVSNQRANGMMQCSFNMKAIA